VSFKGEGGQFAIPLVVAGAVTPLLIPPLPVSSVPCLLLMALITLLWPWCRAHFVIPILCFVLPLCWTLLTLERHDRLRLDAAAAGTVHEISGTVVGIPQKRNWGLQFRFRPDRDDKGGPGSAGQIRVNWYRTASQVSAGERWRLHLRLQPPRSRLNFSGPDRERWYYAEGIAAVGSVVSGANRLLETAQWFNLDALRHHIRDRILAVLGAGRASGMLTGLTVADRSGLSTADRLVLNSTGTGHLLAISGLHIGLISAAAYAAGRVLVLLLPCAWCLRTAVAIPWCLSLTLATLYSALSGFAVSTRRALVMLAVIAVLGLLRRAASPPRALLLALAVVLLLEPLAPLQAGFWLSFMAVAVLLLLFVPRGGRPPAWRALPIAQAALTVTLMPLGLYWFQQTSFAGAVSNLVAIPWASLVIIPLALAAVFSMALPGQLAEGLLSLAAIAADALWWLLDWFAQFPDSSGYAIPRPGAVAVVLAVCAALMLLLPKGFRWRWIGVAGLLPLLLPAGSRVSEGELQLHLLDVGQGLSVLIADHERLMLYDTGPGDGAGSDLVRGVIAPAMANAGFRDLQHLIVSHGDLDHAGGLHTVLKRYPGARSLASLGPSQATLNPCVRHVTWNWPGTRFTVLHPSPQLPYLGNDSSCVLGIHHGRHSVLLTGDISAAVEQRLVLEDLAAYDVLFVPHHGSASSSSPEFIEAVAPRIALVAAGAGNRFGFPRPDVIERYRQSGVRLLSTSDCGAIEVTLGKAGEVGIRSARRYRKGRWRWPPATLCP
jgi:competence protein ComEC